MPAQPLTAWEDWFAKGDSKPSCAGDTGVWAPKRQKCRRREIADCEIQAQPGNPLLQSSVSLCHGGKGSLCLPTSSLAQRCCESGATWMFAVHADGKRRTGCLVGTR